MIVRSLVQLAKGLGKKTIAEFVEDQETLDLLRQEGVDYAQGYHIAKPGPLAAIAHDKQPQESQTGRSPAHNTAQSMPSTPSSPLTTRPAVPVEEVVGACPAHSLSPSSTGSVARARDLRAVRAAPDRPAHATIDRPTHDVVRPTSAAPGRTAVASSCAPRRAAGFVHLSAAWRVVPRSHRDSE
jgi:hypothetical protein